MLDQGEINSSSGLQTDNGMEPVFMHLIQYGVRNSVFRERDCSISVGREEGKRGYIRNQQENELDSLPGPGQTVL